MVGEWRKYAWNHGPITLESNGSAEIILSCRPPSFGRAVLQFCRGPLESVGSKQWPNGWGSGNPTLSATREAHLINIFGFYITFYVKKDSAVWNNNVSSHCSWDLHSPQPLFQQHYWGMEINKDLQSYTLAHVLGVSFTRIIRFGELDSSALWASVQIQHARFRFLKRCWGRIHES